MTAKDKRKAKWSQLTEGAARTGWLIHHLLLLRRFTKIR